MSFDKLKPRCYNCPVRGEAAQRIASIVLKEGYQAPDCPGPQECGSEAGATVITPIGIMSVFMAERHFHCGKETDQRDGSIVDGAVVEEVEPPALPDLFRGMVPPRFLDGAPDLNRNTGPRWPDFNRSPDSRDEHRRDQE